MSKLVLVTGVGRGLGRAMTEGFLAAGCTVLCCTRSPKAIEELQQVYGNARDFASDFASVDVADAEQVQQWRDRLLKSYNPPDLLINNAGIINEPAPLWQVSGAEFDAVIDVNIKGTANVIRAFVPAMIQQQRGIIVNFSSGWGRSTSPGVAPYCATKWAIEGLTRALAQELPAPMAAFALNPGVIHTDMLQTCFGDAAASYTNVSDWAKKAVPYLLGLQGKKSGTPLTVPI